MACAGAMDVAAMADAAVKVAKLMEGVPAIVSLDMNPLTRAKAIS
jgi:hypothetical protein